MISRIPDTTTIGERDLRHWRTAPGRWLASLAALLQARLGPRAVIVLPSLVGLLAFSVAVWGAGEMYEAIAEQGDVAVLDQPVLEWMVAHRSTALNWLAIGFTQTGGPIGMPIIATRVTVLLARRWRSWTPVVLMVIAVAGSLTATIVGKRLGGRIRPPLADAVAPFEHSPSLPSGHSLNSIVIGGLIAYLLLIHVERQATRWWIVGLAALYALCMGLTRIYLGHHWLSDVLTAWFLGAAWLTVVITVHRLYLTAHPQPADPPEQA